MQNPFGFHQQQVAPNQPQVAPNQPQVAPNQPQVAEVALDFLAHFVRIWRLEDANFGHPHDNVPPNKQRYLPLVPAIP